MKTFPSTSRPTAFAVLLIQLLVPSSVYAQTDSHANTAVRQTVERFHEALARGDSVAVAGLLAEDLVVLEGGQAETREEYLSHHFRSDVAFLSALEQEDEHVDVTVEALAAWASTTSRMHGVFRDRNIDSNSAELLVLRHTGGRWEITAIHWSSGSR